MNLAQLSYFRHLSKIQHYTRASEELHISQSALSHSIASLEDELGCSLFRKEGRNVYLTDDGRVFQNYVGATRANVRVKIYRPILLSTSGKSVKYVYDIIVPVYYTRKISESVETIPDAYKDIYFVE